MLWGASFPLALAAVGRDEKDPARLVGTVYAANTVGGIIGALFGSLLIIAWLGTQDAQRILIALAAISAIVALVPSIAQGDVEAARSSSRGLVWGASRRSLSLLLIKSVPPVPPLLVGYGRWFATRLDNENDFIYMGEGMTASVAVSQLSNGVLNYHNAGKVQASSEPQDMRLQRMLGHLTTLLPPTAELGARHRLRRRRDRRRGEHRARRVESETIAEIEPLVPKVVSKYFGAHNFNVVDEPEGARRDRRRAPLHSHDEAEVRRGHVRPARPVGEGRGDAVHARSSSTS